MNPFPFIGGSYAARSPAFDNQRTVNLYPETSGSGTSKSVAMLIGCPGTDLWLTLPDYPIRGSLRLSSTLAVIAAGGSLFQVSDAAAPKLIGAISRGSTPVSMATDGVYVMIVTGPTGYFLTIATMKLTAIDDPAFSGADAAWFIDGFFAFNTPKTQEFQITGLYATTIDALDFASAEGSPDLLVTLIVDHRELWLFGQTSTEVWFNAGAADFPFERIQGAFIEQGCAAKYSVAKLDNTVVWLTADERGHGTVQKAVGYTPQRISTHALEFAIASYSRIDDAVAYSYQQEGHLFYVLTFPTGQATWVYDSATELWHERAWRDPATGLLSQHRGICHLAFAGKNLVGDYENGNIYALNLDTYTDNGAILPAIRQCPHFAKGNAWQFFSKLWIDMQMGVGINPIVPVITPLFTVTVGEGNGNAGYATLAAALAYDLAPTAFGSLTSPAATVGGAALLGVVFNPSSNDFLLMLQGAVSNTAVFSIYGAGQLFDSKSASNVATFGPFLGTYVTTFVFPAVGSSGQAFQAGASVVFTNPIPTVLDPSDPHLILEWSDDGGQSFGNQVTVSMGKLGERTKRANFRRLGKSRDRIWRATITDPVKRIFIGAGVEFSVGS